jgi:hypothetical protein
VSAFRLAALLALRERQEEAARGWLGRAAGLAAAAAREADERERACRRGRPLARATFAGDLAAEGRERDRLAGAAAAARASALAAAVVQADALAEHAAARSARDAIARAHECWRKERRGALEAAQEAEAEVPRRPASPARSAESAISARRRRPP